MTDSRYAKTMLILSALGVAFSGYLSAVRLVTSTCALGEPCPYFLGYPACWFGFALFMILFDISIVALVRREYVGKIAKAHLFVSGLGIAFAGYFALPEIGRLVAGESRYALGLPTCAYGLIAFASIFALALARSRRGEPRASRQ